MYIYILLCRYANTFSRTNSVVGTSVQPHVDQDCTSRYLYIIPLFMRTTHPVLNRDQGPLPVDEDILCIALCDLLYVSISICVHSPSISSIGTSVPPQSTKMARRRARR